MSTMIESESVMSDWLSEGITCGCSSVPREVGDDWLILSSEIQGDLLSEGKSLGTAPEVDLVMLDKDQTMQSQTNPEDFDHRRRQGVTIGKRKLDKIKLETEPAFLSAVTLFQEGKIDKKEMRTRVVKAMKKAWKGVFIAGVRAAGIPGQVGKSKKWRVELSSADEKWLKSAMKHEMQFLNKFLTHIEAGEGRMPYPRRIKMYVGALESFYQSARMIGVPALVEIHWTISKEGKAKNNICASCTYLAKHSPYTKRTLPTTPRSGMTLCITHCRDKLTVKKATPQRIQQIEDDSKYTRGSHIKNLRKIKKQGHL
jgi:hypothetical protein